MNNQDNYPCICGHIFKKHNWRKKFIKRIIKEFKTTKNPQYSLERFIEIATKNRGESECDSCFGRINSDHCSEFKADNLKYLEDKYDESK